MQRMASGQQNRIIRIICAILALYFVNISIDAPDIEGQNQSYNEQDSVIELIVEKGFDFEDAIDDYDSEESAETITKKSNIDLCVVPLITESLPQNTKPDEAEESNILKQLNTLMLLRCFSPPPEI